MDKSHGDVELDHFGEQAIAPDFVKGLFVVEEGRDGHGFSFFAVKLVGGALRKLEYLVGCTPALSKAGLILAEL